MTNKYELEMGGRVFEFEFGKIAKEFHNNSNDNGSASVQIA